MFGSVDAVGRTIDVDGQSVRVGAVVRTPPANTTIPFETVFGPTSSLAPPQIRDELVTGSRGWWGRMLVRVRPGAPVGPIRAALQDAVDHAAVLQKIPAATRARLGGRKVMDVELVPLGEAYFDRDVAANSLARPGPRGDKTVVAGLGAIALLILLLAAINYVNLATARVVRRQREIAMRKVLGASPRRIAMQFIAEALLVALLATSLGLLFAWLALPLFAELVARDLGGLLSPSNVAAALALGVVVGLASAIHPVWAALRVPPHGALSGRQDDESVRAGRVRKAMTVLQIGAAMGLACVTLAITWQTRYALAQSPGFDPSSLLVVDRGARADRGAQGQRRGGRRGDQRRRGRPPRRRVVARSAPARRGRRARGDEIRQPRFLRALRHPSRRGPAVRSARRCGRRDRAVGRQRRHGAPARFRHAGRRHRPDGGLHEFRRQRRPQADRRRRARTALPFAARGTGRHRL
jgi:hypothetical protein